MKIRGNEAIAVLRNRISAMLGLSHGGARDLYEVFGYPREVRIETLQGLYLRNDIASRIVRAYPQATWREEPVLRDEAGDSSEPGSESYSPFAEACENFFEEHNLWRAIERADRLSSVGRFGILLLGFKDGKGLHEPMTKGKSEMLYASPYGEPDVQVAKFDTNIHSPRFGLPELYSIRQTTSGVMSAGAPTRSVLNVHWTRVLHIAEYLDSDDTFGVPRLLSVVNRLMDLEKVVGGSAETFWLSANRGLALWADKEAALSEDDIESIKGQADEFQHQLRRYLVGSGMTAQILGADDPDPGPNADKLLDLISGATGIPKRILIGSERGELSSSQDENNWAARIDERRRNFASPMILRPLTNLLILTENLPAPSGKWWPVWPETNMMDPVQKSQVAANKASALANYMRTPGAELVVPPQEFRRDFLELPPESEYELPPEFEDIHEEPEPVEGEGDSDEPDTNAAARTLYVQRKVLNAGSIVKWAKAQGFKDIEKDLHVTIAYSRRPVDWMKVTSVPWGQDEEGRMTIMPGGPRVVEPLGDKGAIVLFFSSSELAWRHEAIKQESGASYDFDNYQPHVTITYNGDVDLENVEPYRGPIVLGPEIFEEVQ